MEKSESDRILTWRWLLFFRVVVSVVSTKKNGGGAFSQNDHWLVGFNLTYLKHIRQIGKSPQNRAEKYHDLLISSLYTWGFPPPFYSKHKPGLVWIVTASIPKIGAPFHL